MSVHATMPTTKVAESRLPAVAGRFYPSASDELKSTLGSYLDAVRDPHLSEVRAVIAPHAGYPCSGQIAAYSFKALSNLTEAAYTVFLLGPAHYAFVDGVGLSSASAFETPLGPVPVAVDIVASLLAHGPYYRLTDAAHAPEHCLEVELPFLQMMLSDFRIVPMLFDEAADPRRTAQDLIDLLAADANMLIVVSSDLSHNHSFDDATERDNSLLTAITHGEMATVQHSEACGRLAILCLMHLAQKLGWQPHRLAYTNSGATCGPHRNVVGYGAVAYTAQQKAEVRISEVAHRNSSARAPAHRAFEEVEHTADWALRVRGRDFCELLQNAARGMSSLLVADLSLIPNEIDETIVVEGDDAESLLVNWLSELAYRAEMDGIVFRKFTLYNISPQGLCASVRGGLVPSLEKHIKAVTYHNLQITKSEGGLEATVVFDV
jgi:AmmeMemoRadiSam system protein B